MSESEIKDFVNTQLIQASAGYTIETNKFDLKREWYQLSTQAGESEFLKDACAIVNSYGRGHGFIVVGYDDKDKKIHSTSFKDCGLKDVTDIYGIIKRRIDRPFNIEIIELEYSKTENVSIMSHQRLNIQMKYLSEKGQHRKEHQNLILT
jgi:hypothetical protein